MSPVTPLALRSARSNQGPPSRLPLMVGHMTKGHQSGMVAAAHKDIGMRVWSPFDSREKEVKSSGVGSTSHHCRSLSIDRFMMGNLNVGAVGQQMSSPPPVTTELNGGRGASIGSAASPFVVELANVKFSEDEKKKIVSDKSVSEIILTDPRRVKRILNNHASAGKSKENKMKYIGEFQHKLQVLQSQTTMLCAQVTVMQRNNDLVSQNNELKTRLQAMDQQAQWGDALIARLTAEAQHLRAVVSEISGSHLPSG
uniref:BZIP domain-containing protein n=1 Tax=Oryza punctata TaxID=4537 RepID=A0A0E0KMW5_ORYPU